MLKLQKRFDALRKQLDNIKLELDAKVLHCEKLKEERDALRQKFEEAILNVQQRSSMYNSKCLFCDFHKFFLCFFLKALKVQC